jgi:Lon protease-like protein
MLPPEIPLFPLPNVVLFPGAFLPLHIFEPRYRAMLADALAGDRVIGLVLLRPGRESDDEARPPVYPIGCAGLISHADRLDDGRYNIILRGLEKFRIVSETTATGAAVAHPYRLARIEPIPEEAFAGGRDAFRDERGRLEALLAAHLAGGGRNGSLPRGVSDEDLVNALAQHLALDPLEKQALLETDGLLARCHSLIELLEMKELAGRVPSSTKTWTH